MRNLTAILVAAAALSLSACGEPTVTDTPRRIMTQQPDMQAVKLKLAFTCAYEKDRTRRESEGHVRERVIFDRS